MGRVKTAFWSEACAEYEKRIARFRPFTITEVRDADQSLPVEKRNAAEGERLIAALGPHDVPIVLDERGKDFTSPSLAKYLAGLDQAARGTPAFIIGGPFGLTDDVRRRAALLLRLSAMTFPHELARAVLLEQIYRTECIRRGIPYHHYTVSAPRRRGRRRCRRAV